MLGAEFIGDRAYCGRGEERSPTREPGLRKHVRGTYAYESSATRSDVPSVSDPAGNRDRRGSASQTAAGRAASSVVAGRC